MTFYMLFFAFDIDLPYYAVMPLVVAVVIGVAGVEPHPVIPSDETKNADKETVQSFALENRVVAELVDAIDVEVAARAVQEKQKRREIPVPREGAPQ